jgi:hypothetical protein
MVMVFLVKTRIFTKYNDAFVPHLLADIAAYMVSHREQLLQLFRERMFPPKNVQVFGPVFSGFQKIVMQSF